MLLPSVTFLVAVSSAMEFTPYRPSEQYKCGAFLQNRVKDKALDYFYSSIDHVITLLSNQFPHEELLNRQALLGDVNEVRLSIETKYVDWWSWQRGWLIATGVIVLLGVLLPIVYLFYRCCVCCCSQSSRKENTDSRYDGCKRNFLNAIMTLLVLLDVFAAATLLITGQYAEHGLEELPNRLNYCIDDLNLYKRDTDARIRKLLIDDYQMLNRTVSSQLSYAGHEVVQGVKKLTGANTIDALMNISKSADEIDQLMKDTYVQVKEIEGAYTNLEVQYKRLQSTLNKELETCLKSEIDSLKRMCHKAQGTLAGIAPTHFDSNLETIRPSIEKTLDQIKNANIPQLLNTTLRKFSEMEEKIQAEIDKKIHSSQSILKNISDNLFRTAETISTQIRQINFDSLYDVVTRASDPKDSIAAKVVHYSRTISLVITSIFMLIAFCFLLGLFYGICGHRPTFYNDDCCVRSTGGRFYSCGIWLTMATFTALSIVTAVLFFTVGNTSDILCRTLRDPLSRSDIIKLGERYLEIMRSKEQPSDDLLSLMRDHSMADLIRACQRNETLYEVFQIDKKYNLKRLKLSDKQDYDTLERFLSITLKDLPAIGPINHMISNSDFQRLQKLAIEFNRTESRRFNLSEINASLSKLNLKSKMEELENMTNSRAGKPKAVTSMLTHIEDVDDRFAQPLRSKLTSLLKNLNRLNKRLEEIDVPVSTLLSKLQHAQALLSEDLRGTIQKAAQEQLSAILANINQYVDHVKHQMQHDISSCVPVAAIISSATAAVCDYTVDPLNGAWMSMLISLLCLVPMLVFATVLVNLYGKMHSFPKYVVETPPDHHHLSSFITDTYETRQKPGYTNYSHTDNYHRTFR